MIDAASRTGWNKINGIKAKRICSTENISQDEFKAMRREGEGGSDLAAILRVHPYKTSLDVYLDKIGIDRDRSDNEEEIMYWGSAFEDAIAKRYSEKSGNPIQRVRAMLQGEEPWMLANIDRLIVPPGGARGVLECKLVTSHHEIEKWNGGETIPLYHAVQLQWYLGITGLGWGQFAANLGARKLVTPEFYHDDELFQQFVDIGRLFWEENVLKQVPPLPSSENPTAEINSLKRLYPNDTGQQIDVPEEIGQLFEKIKSRTAEARELDKEIDAMKARIMHHMGEARVAVFGNLEARWPLIEAKGYTVEPKSYRKFSINKHKEDNNG